MLGAMNQMAYIGNPQENYWIATLTSTFSPVRVRNDSAGNILMAGDDGSTFSNLLKMTSAGDISWQVKLDSTSHYDLICDSSNNIYTTGFVSSGNGGDYSITKYNSSGTLQFQNRFNYGGGTRVDVGRAVTVASDGSVYASGDSYLASNTTYYPLTVKYNSSGTLQTNAGSFETGTPGYCYNVAVDSSGNYYTLIMETSTGFLQPVIIKRSSSSVLSWKSTLLFGSGTYGQVRLDSSNNLYHIGQRTVSSSQYGSVVKLDSTAGTISWNKLIRSGNAYFNDAAIDSSGNIYAIGRVTQSVNRVLIVKFDPSGNVVWQRTITQSVDGTNFALNTDASISVSGDNMYILLPWSNRLLFKLPTDGSKTGTYTPSGSTGYVLTYGASTYTVTDGSTSTEVVTSATMSTINSGSSSTAFTTGTTSYTSSLVNI